MLVSVVIPSYNHSSYILEAVESVLSQTHEEIELIVIDDGSSDNSLELLATVDDQRLTVIAQENAGAHETINRGLQMARGDHLTILNSDDVYHPERLKRCLGALAENNANFACSWIQVIDANSAPTSIKRGWENMLPSWANPNSEDGFWNGNSFNLNLLATNFISTTSNMIFTRELLESAGYMRNLRFCHDWDFAIRAAAVGSCVMVEEPLVQYRVHGSNTISTNQNWMLFETCWVLAANAERFGDLGLFGGSIALPQLLEQVAGAQASIGARECERLLAMLALFISSRRSELGEVAAEQLLDDADLRGEFIKILEG